MNTPDDDSGADVYSDADYAYLQSTVPAPLAPGVCTECRGTGRVDGETSGTVTQRLDCPECRREDEADEDTCAECDGEGWLVGATYYGAVEHLACPSCTEPEDDGDTGHDSNTGIALYGEI